MEIKMAKFKLFDMNRDGKGVPDDEKPLVLNFFNVPKFIFRKFSKMLSVNLLCLPLAIIPILAVFIFFNGDKMTAQTNLVYSTVYGANIYSNTPATQVLLGVFGLQNQLPVVNFRMVVIYAILAIVLIAIWGPLNTGIAYCSRSLVRGEPVFVLSDCWYAIKKNLKQGLFIGAFDVLCIFVLGFDLIYTENWMFGGVILALAVIYFFMRFYVYQMMITFDLKFTKILKNALIFTAVGLPRNMIMVAWMLLFIIVNVLLFWLLGYLNMSVIAVMIAVFYIFGTGAILSAYSAYPVIEKYMIKTE